MWELIWSRLKKLEKAIANGGGSDGESNTLQVGVTYETDATIAGAVFNATDTAELSAALATKAAPMLRIDNGNMPGLTAEPMYQYFVEMDGGSALLCGYQVPLLLGENVVLVFVTMQIMAMSGEYMAEFMINPILNFANTLT